MCGGFSPHLLSVLLGVKVDSDVGEITQGRRNYNSRSPLSEPES